MSRYLDTAMDGLVVNSYHHHHHQYGGLGPQVKLQINKTVSRMASRLNRETCKLVVLQFSQFSAYHSSVPLPTYHLQSSQGGMNVATLPPHYAHPASHHQTHFVSPDQNLAIGNRKEGFQWWSLPPSSSNAAAATAPAGHGQEKSSVPPALTFMNPMVSNSHSFAEKAAAEGAVHGGSCGGDAFVSSSASVFYQSPSYQRKSRRCRCPNCLDDLGQGKRFLLALFDGLSAVTVCGSVGAQRGLTLAFVFFGRGRKR